MDVFKDKNVFITGAASGIGRSFALALADLEMNLFITDINMENLENVKKELEEKNVIVYASKCDVCNYKEFEEVSKDFHEKLGDIDLLINNAGIAIVGSIDNIILEDWKKVLDVNLWSIVHSIKAFLPNMLKRGSGHIVNIASGAGIFGSVEPLPYITSKFGVVGLTEALFARLKKRGINVSVIAPTYIKTDIFKLESEKIAYSPKLLDDHKKEKIDEIYREIFEEIMKSAMSPDRAIKKYIRGIKKNQLYIFDVIATSQILAMKGNNPQQYEDFLVMYQKNREELIKKHFLQHGINIEDYIESY
ncbi:MAG: SDR family NAD(P)-dependent oxidoreductase [Candidatus Lokiarchaeota archaeon]|nr:SDR family NAD(P)-dependent oxidoreductase [Candidatus Lokiarchaeota archaeon]